MAWTDPLPLLTFAFSYAALAAVPGTNFLAVSHASIQGRAFGLAAAAGVACGASVLAALAFIGLALVPMPPAAGPVLALAYGGVLLHTGLACLRARRGGGTGQCPIAREALRRPFRFGFAVAALNPVSLAFFAAAAADAAATDAAAVAICIGAVFAIALGWFGGIGLVLSTAGLRAAYLQARRLPELGIGVALVLMGGTALADAAMEIWTNSFLLNQP